jgi:hypothetical protein
MGASTLAQLGLSPSCEIELRIAILALLIQKQSIPPARNSLQRRKAASSCSLKFT